MQNQNPSIAWCTHCSDLQITANQIIFHIFQEKSCGFHTRLPMVNHRCPFSDFYWGEGALVHRLHPWHYLYVFWSRRSFTDPICCNFCMVLSMFYRLVLANFFIFSARHQLDTINSLGLLPPRRHVVWRDSVIFNYCFTIVRFVEMNFEQFHQQSQPYIAHCSSTFLP